MNDWLSGFENSNFRTKWINEIIKKFIIIKKNFPKANPNLHRDFILTVKRVSIIILQKHKL